MNEPNQNPTDSVNQGCSPPVPETLLTASRYKLTDLKLQTSYGSLPKDLQGHVFVVTSVGSVTSGGLPHPDGTPIFNGDGMIYRFDFDQPEEVRVTTRIAKPPCYYADKATRPGTEYDKYKFRNHGLGRFNLTLGFRNELNTAFVPMLFSDQNNERLLVTYDAGRPYEIDTETLEAVTPVGFNKEWQPEAPLNFPFPPFLSTAHPGFDSYTNELFTVNYGRSSGNFLETIPFLYDLEELPQEFEAVLAIIAEIIENNFFTDIFNIFSKFSQDILQFASSLIETFIKIKLTDFVYLIRWDGSSNLERWKLLLPDGSPIQIEQSMHQMGVTEDYIVLMDTAFRFGIDQILNNPIPNSKALERFLRIFLTRPQSPDSVIYLIRRADLKNGQRLACEDGEVEVRVKKVVIPMEAVHFLVDYDNKDNKITLHLAHVCAFDAAEWLRSYDNSAFPSHKPAPSRLRGIAADETDISRIGRYVIDGETTEILDSKILANAKHTWGLVFYAYRDRLSTGQYPRKLDNIYWTSFGLWQQTLTQFIVNLYKDYKYRAVPVSELMRLANHGVPSSLFRLHNSSESISIADSYEFPESHIVSSPQFVPRRDGGDGSTDGYIFCTVVAPDKKEIWIFDAQDLAGGPKCKLHHPSLIFGATIHTAWLPKIARRTATYHVGVRQDYEDIVKHKSRKIQDLFEKEIYPHFEES